MTSARTATRAPTLAVAATLVVATACWLIAVRQMSGMDMGPATRLGSFAPFIALWVVMTAAMMLPGTAFAVIERGDDERVGAGRAVLFVTGYLAVWALVGVVVYAVYRPHGTVAAAVLTIAAGLYEVTPLKREFRRRCREHGRSGVAVPSGVGYGLCCVGSSIGLMLIMVTVGVMNIGWMAVIGIVAAAQKLLPLKTAIDLSLAVAIVGLGVWILLAPWSVPGLQPPM